MNPEPTPSEAQKVHSTRPKIPPHVSAVLAALLAGFLLGAGTVLYLVAKKGLTFRFSAAPVTAPASASSSNTVPAAPRRPGVAADAATPLAQGPAGVPNVPGCCHASRSQE